jgi:hypothetical protein
MAKMFSKKKLNEMEQRIQDLEFKLKWQKHKHEKELESLVDRRKMITPPWLIISKEEFKDLFSKIKDISKNTPLYFVEVCDGSKEERYVFVHGEVYKLGDFKTIAKGTFFNFK